MMPLSISISAQRDLEEIWLFTFLKWSQEQADYYMSLFYEALANLESFPELGKDISYIKDGYRYLSVKSHLIF